MRLQAPCVGRGAAESTIARTTNGRILIGEPSSLADRTAGELATSTEEGKAADRPGARTGVLGDCLAFRYTATLMNAPGGEKECCHRTRERWMARIRKYFTSFPVIKDVPCDECREIIEIRVYGQPAA